MDRYGGRLGVFYSAQLVSGTSTKRTGFSNVRSRVHSVLTTARGCGDPPAQPLRLRTAGLGEAGGALPLVAAAAAARISVIGKRQKGGAKAWGLIRVPTWRRQRRQLAGIPGEEEQVRAHGRGARGRRRSPEPEQQEIRPRLLCLRLPQLRAAWLRCDRGLNRASEHRSGHSFWEFTALTVLKLKEKQSNPHNRNL